MATISREHEPRPRERSWWLAATDAWASLAIAVIWLAVLFDAVYGPDMHFESGTAASGSNTTIPSAVAVALFAVFATRAVAKYGFRDDDRRTS